MGLQTMQIHIRHCGTVIGKTYWMFDIFVFFIAKNEIISKRFVSFILCTFQRITTTTLQTTRMPGPVAPSDARPTGIQSGKNHSWRWSFLRTFSTADSNRAVFSYRRKDVH